MIISPDDFLYQKDPTTGQQTYVWSPTRVKAAWQETFRLLERAIRDPKFTKLVLLVGIPAAGKSTWLKSHHEQDAIYIDATFTQKWSRKKPVELAKQYGKQVEAVYLDVPLPVSLERNSQRSPDRRVPDDTIINMAVNLSQEPPSMSEGFDKIIKVQTKQASSSGPAELHVYDFDATLFRSPDMSARWKNWWMEERSLTLPCVPDKPGPEWWNGAVVAEAKKSISNPNVYAVLITGRSDRVFRWRIPEMLRDAGLKFDAVFLNQGGNVPAFKTDVVKRLLGRYRFIDQVKVWDDSADNHVALKREVEGQGLSYEGIKPKIKPMPVDCDEEAEANPKIKPVYTAVFLDSASRKSLEDWWETNVGPLVGEAIVDHVTLVKKPTPESVARLPFGAKFKFRVTGWADNGAVQAVSVEPPPELLVESGVPHVTVSTDGTPPSASLDLIKSGVNRVNGPILTGTLGWSDGNRPHYKTASRIAGENEPTNPKLWSKAVAEAKKRFKVYPCVPVDSSEALSRQGWKRYDQLGVGDEIVTYNRERDCLEWGEIQRIHFYEDAPLIRLKKPATCFDFLCTPDHNWVIRHSPRSGEKYKLRARKYADQLVPAKNITKHMNIITSARMEEGGPVSLSGFRKHEWSWTERVLAMSHEQREAWFASAVIYDGHENQYSDKNQRCSYGFSQKNQDHADATAICGVLLGFNVTFRKKRENPTITTYTFIDRRTHNTQNVQISQAGNAAVWCPETVNGTWVMRQGSMITVTGNSAYANGWASKWYKERGGKWRKKAAVPSALKPAPKDHPDPRELAMGIKVELEHTKNKAIAERIALHHLAEDPKYYTHLLAMEARYVKAAAQAPGTHTLPPLPYAYDALEPYISEETLRNHHGKHHKAYVEGLNKAEKKLAEAQDDADFDGVFGLQSMQAFNWSGHFLHSLYWKCLTPPDKHREPSDAFVKAIEADFTSWDTFKAQFKASVKTVQGSGWAVLVHGPTGFKIASVRNHEDKVLWGETALLPMDAWEHAYYLDYESDREAYFDAVFDHLINWEYVESRFAQARNIRIARSKVGKIDPDWVKGVRAWIKKTFVPKAKYASLDDLIAHLKTLRDKDLNRFWEYLFYTKGFLPPSGEGFDSVIAKIKLKVQEELKAAKVILDDELSRIENTRDAMTPGTQVYRMDQMRGPDWSILGFYESIDPKDPFGAALRGYEDVIKETLGKVEDVLSGKLLRAITAFITKYVPDPSVPWELDEILLEYNIGNVKLVYDGEPSRSLINRPDPADPRGLKEYIPYFKTVKALLDRKGFGNLWYGPVFVGCPKCGGENPLGKHFGVGAQYLTGSDHVVVYLEPKPFLVELLIHELGHRYYYKFMDSGDRARFDSYFKEVAAVSEYGSKATEEDFAEVFAHFILGRDMTRDQIERFKAFLAKKDRGRFASSSNIAARYLAGRKFKMPRKFDRKHCESKTCDEMGFTEKASCRPYKDCYRSASEQTNNVDTFVSDFFRRYPKLSKYQRHLRFRERSEGGSSGHGEARQHGNEVWLFPKFWKLPREVQDFVLAHEIGHWVKSEFGGQRFIALANEIGIDPWDTSALPFAQFNMDEAFADSFASYHTDGDVQKRYPAWTQLTEAVLGGARVAAVIAKIPASVLYDTGWEWDEEGFANWPSFLKKPKSEQIEWAKEYAKGGIRDPVEVTVYSNGTAKFEDGHHRVMAGTLLGIDIPVRVGFRNFDASRWPDLLDLLRAGYTRRDYNPQGWSLQRSGVPPLEVVRRGRDAADEWIMAADGARVARGKAKKDVGHGGLDEWFSGHGGAKGKGEEARWGDWVAISPVKKTLDSGKKVSPGDIVGPCGISDDPDWKEITKGGKDPLKCMPRQKAHDMPKKERAEKAKGKLRAERKDSDRKKKPTMTPTFEDK